MSVLRKAIGKKLEKLIKMVVKEPEPSPYDGGGGPSGISGIDPNGGTRGISGFGNRPLATFLFDDGTQQTIAYKYPFPKVVQVEVPSVVPAPTGYAIGDFHNINSSAAEPATFKFYLKECTAVGGQMHGYYTVDPANIAVPGMVEETK